jgi:hypothetical protein
MGLFAWLPKFFSNRIDTPSNYDYSCSVSGNMITLTTGLGNDAITAASLDGKVRWPVFSLSDKLVADPCLFRINGRFVRLFTCGNSDGRRNGIAYHYLNSSGVFGSHKFIVPQVTSGSDYANGQPSVLELPNGFFMMWYRTFGDLNRALILDRSLNVVKEVPFRSPEDGASPEIFWFEGKVWKLFSGGEMVGLRSFRYENDMLVRERELEVSYPLSGGGYFNCRYGVRFPQQIDGPGIVKDAANKVVVDSNRQLTFWNGAGSSSDPGTWELRKGVLTIPK